jgi:hypothetical protein
MTYPPISGSITPLDVSVALGLYLSERNKSAFKDIILTFSDCPKLQKVSGTLSNRYNSAKRLDWGMSTNLEAAFKAVLDHAKTNYVPAEDMPQCLLILSDMEFNACIRNPGQTLFENLQTQYENAGYKLPKVVFWNLNSRQAQNNPVTVKDKNTSLVSGYSPTIMQNVLRQQNNPLQMVLDTVMVPRYDYKRG